jgi:hypothetical protein
MQTEGDPNKKDARLKDNVFTKIEKGIQTLKKKQVEAQRKLEKGGETMIDTLNEKNIRMAKEKMSVTSLINPNTNLIGQIKRTQSEMINLSKIQNLKKKNGGQIDEGRQAAYTSSQTSNVSPRKFLIDKRQTSISKSPKKMMLSPMKLQNFGPKIKNSGTTVKTFRQTVISEMDSSDEEMEAMIKAADEKREQMRIDEELEFGSGSDDTSRLRDSKSVSIDENHGKSGLEDLD